MSVFETDEEYDDLCSCRCPRLPGTHGSGECANAEAGK